MGSKRESQNTRLAADGGEALMLHLQDGDASVVVTPEYGGAMLGWMDDRTPVLRRPVPDAILRGDVRGFACFPLVPYCNRIAFARFAWQGRTYQVDRNFGDHPHAIHGVGWQRPWSVRAVSGRSTILTLHHDAAGNRAGAWPFPFDAELSYTLSGTQLRIAMAVTNRHTSPAPAGIGLHPYFPRGAGVTLPASRCDSTQAASGSTATTPCQRSMKTCRANGSMRTDCQSAARGWTIASPPGTARRGSPGSAVA
jgi:galactose mutarotase-like enzyme